MCGRGPLCFVERESGNRVGVIVTDDPNAATVSAGDIEIRLNR
jgi:hypothetical protein